MMIFEYATNGNLRDYLRVRRLADKKLNDRYNSADGNSSASNAVHNLAYQLSSAGSVASRPRDPNSCKNSNLLLVNTGRVSTAFSSRSSDFPSPSVAFSPSSGYGSEPRCSESGCSNELNSRESCASPPYDCVVPSPSNHKLRTRVDSSGSFDDLINQNIVLSEAEADIDDRDGSVFKFPPPARFKQSAQSQRQSAFSEQTPVSPLSPIAITGSSDCKPAQFERIKLKQLIDFALQIAKGLEYLTERKVSRLFSLSFHNFSLHSFFFCF